MNVCQKTNVVWIKLYPPHPNVYALSTTLPHSERVLKFEKALSTN